MFLGSVSFTINICFRFSRKKNHGNHLTPVEQNAVLIGGVSRPLLLKKR
jgi:hypothetical protein